MRDPLGKAAFVPVRAERSGPAARHGGAPAYRVRHGGSRIVIRAP